ncbi:MAG: PIN domain-containing protein [Anaerolineae bacterium]
MDRALIDTDIFSEILKGIDRNVVTRATTYRALFRRYTISSITVVEIVKGLHKARRESQLQQFLSGLTSVDILTLNTQSAIIAGRIYGDLERAGQPIGRADPLIAAIAIQHNLVLVTGNQEHYGRVRDLGYNLKLDNWR